MQIDLITLQQRTSKRNGFASQVQLSKASPKIWYGILEVGS